MATLHPDVGLEIERALRGGRMSAAQLVAALGISQPTFSRAIQSLNRTVTSFKVSGERTPQYALLRQLPLGLSPRQRIYAVSGSGKVEPFADVEFLAGGATLERIGGSSGTTRIYEGLPPYMAFAAPSGFLGRQLAHEAARAQQFPASLKDWGDDHMVAYLFSRGMNLPGNLVFGDVCLQAEIDFRGARPTPVAEKVEHYVAMASALKGASYGSSAGGEQPKFLGLTEDSGHVIVKFAKAGSRMAELLPLEHLALRTLGELGVPASRTQLLAGGDYVFLEVQRFDRKGLNGRVGMLSARSVDDEFFGKLDSWSEFAARCVQARYVKPQDAFWVDTMTAFSELIGNTDRHFENLSMLIGEDSEYLGIAPAYDILPMRYASLGGGVDPDLTTVQPKVGAVGAKPEVWSLAAKAAERFWSAAQTEEFAAPLSPEMKELSARNLAAAMAFVEPLLPTEEPEAKAVRRPRMR
ncbi:DNA-binding transcriptional ArsR family regulator [Roseateles asaccharophilus]|uniref:HipA domain-containing protein n=1 Tax=Roseateles asaccharophilus TaxID=582607 RepID=UPI0038393855